MKFGAFCFSFLIIFLCISFGASFAADIKIPPSPNQWITDTVGFLSPETISLVNSQLETYEQTTGHQILVYIGKTTGGYPIEEFAVKAFAAWKVGRKNIDDGLVLFIMTGGKEGNRDVRIEVGYGLEGVVTDVKASQVIHDIFIPLAKSKDYDNAVRQSVDKLLDIISGKTPPSEKESHLPSAGLGTQSVFQIAIVGIGIIFFLILFITNPGLAVLLLLNIASGSRGGGDGGGYSGGGGRSGGGGASGNW